MIGKTNRLVNQEVRYRYGNEATADVAAISQNDNEFVKVAAEFDTSISEESASRARLQRAGNLTKYLKGAVENREEDKT